MEEGKRVRIRFDQEEKRREGRRYEVDTMTKGEWRREDVLR